MILTIDIKDSVADKILYFLESLKKDVKIVKDSSTEELLDIEQIDENDDDYKFYMEAKQARKDGEKIYSLEDVMKAMV